MILHLATQNLFSWSKPQFWKETNLNEGFNQVASQDRKYPIGFKVSQSENTYSTGFFEGLEINDGETVYLHFPDYNSTTPILQFFSSNIDNIDLIIDYKYQTESTADLNLYVNGVLKSTNSSANPASVGHIIYTDTDFYDIKFEASGGSCKIADLDIYLQLKDTNFTDGTRSFEKGTTSIYSRFDGTQNSFGRSSNYISQEFTTTCNKDRSLAIYNLIETAFKYGVELRVATYKIITEGSTSWGTDTWGTSVWGGYEETGAVTDYVDAFVVSHSLDVLTNPCFNDYKINLKIKKTDYYNAIEQ